MNMGVSGGNSTSMPHSASARTQPQSVVSRPRPGHVAPPRLFGYIRLNAVCKRHPGGATPRGMATSRNFSFLAEHDPVFLQLASTAEQVFAADPNTTLIKLRQLGEAIAQDLAARVGIVFDDTTTQADLLFRLGREINLDPTIRGLFHTLRIEGNKATHQFRTLHKEAMDGLRVAVVDRLAPMTLAKRLFPGVRIIPVASRTAL